MKKILIVDDEEPIRRSIRDILDVGDYELFEAGNGFEAMEIVKRESPELVITDIIMPEKEGIETIMELNEDYPEIKIIAISGGGRIGSEEVLSTVEELEVVGTLKKPFSVSELFEMVRKAVS